MPGNILLPEASIQTCIEEECGLDVWAGVTAALRRPTSNSNSCFEKVIPGLTFFEIYPVFWASTLTIRWLRVRWVLPVCLFALFRTWRRCFKIFLWMR
jgi:hypothetical protein